VHAELTMELGWTANQKRVARLMRQGLYRRRRRGCTVRDPDAGPAADLVNRRFAATGPDMLWVTDITEHRTREGKTVLRRRPGRVLPPHRRLVHQRPHAHRTGP
jgi:putative transposase